MFSFKLYPSSVIFTPSRMVWLVKFCKSVKILNPIMNTKNIVFQLKTYIPQNILHEKHILQVTRQGGLFSKLYITKLKTYPISTPNQTSCTHTFLLPLIQSEGIMVSQLSSNPIRRPPDISTELWQLPEIY